MKKIIIGTIALTAGLLLTGCADDRENVAKDFVMALSNADIKKAKSLSYGKTLDSLHRYEDSCSKENIDDTFAYYLKEQKSKFRSVFKGGDKVLSEEKESELKKMIKEAGGKRKAIKEASYKGEEEEAKLYELNKELFPKLINMVGLEVAPYMIDIIAWDDAGKTTRESIKKVRETHSEEITRACYAWQAFNGDIVIKTINTLEMKEISPDKAEVRLELINQKNTSNKITLNVEKIKGEWKAIDSKKDKS